MFGLIFIVQDLIWKSVIKFSHDLPKMIEYKRVIFTLLWLLKNLPCVKYTLM